MKINQYCSVCKKHLDMEVIPTDDGGDDGVIWLRCPECQGFLPKFSGEGLKTEPAAPAAPADTATGTRPGPSDDESPARSTPVKPRARAADAPSTSGDADTDDGAEEDAETEAEAAAEPLAEYAALLAEADTTGARPYRPASTFEVGEVILHLAYDDVGIVVAKEDLPGGRKAVKVYFDQAGVVHLIEQAPDGR